jgi:hypothetical protein
MLEMGTVVLRSSFSILGDTKAFGSMWVKPNSLTLAANPAMWLNLPLAHMVERETSGNLIPLACDKLEVLLRAHSLGCSKLVFVSRKRLIP